MEIYRKRWLIERLFKQIKQNFPLKYFLEIVAQYNPPTPSSY
ncbi:transposase [Porphyromonas gingivalis]